MENEYFKKFADDLEERQKAQQQKKKQLDEDEKAWSVRERDKKYKEDPGNKTTWGK